VGGGEKEREWRDSKNESHPSRLRARAGERGVGAGKAGARAAWPKWPGGGGDVGTAAVAGAVGAAGGWGRTRQVGPTCRRPRERRAAGRPGWASACGRPSGEEGEKKERMGRRPIRKGKGKRKRKRRKGFSLELKYCMLHFNWLKLFLGL
jgi:hypothetical protein